MPGTKIFVPLLENAVLIHQNVMTVKNANNEVQLTALINEVPAFQDVGLYNYSLKDTVINSKNGLYSEFKDGEFTRKFWVIQDKDSKTTIEMEFLSTESNKRLSDEILSHTLYLKPAKTNLKDLEYLQNYEFDSGGSGFKLLGCRAGVATYTEKGTDLKSVMQPYITIEYFDLKDYGFAQSSFFSENVPEEMPTVEMLKQNEETKNGITYKYALANVGSGSRKRQISILKIADEKGILVMTASAGQDVENYENVFKNLLYKVSWK